MMKYVRHYRISKAICCISDRFIKFNAAVCCVVPNISGLQNVLLLVYPVPLSSGRVHSLPVFHIAKKKVAYARQFKTALINSAVYQKTSWSILYDRNTNAD